MYYSIMKILLIYLCFYSFAANAESLKDMRFGDARVGKVISIYDADTFRVNIDNWPEIIGSNIPVRVRGIDAPEIRGLCIKEKFKARKAREFVKKILGVGLKIELKNIQRGKYFRLVADVFVDEKNIAEMLKEASLARPYKGGKRLSWCN